MMLLDDIILMNDLRRKRQHIQRRVIFDKPIMGISLEKICESNRIFRTSESTDSTDTVGSFDILGEEQASMLVNSGYIRESDIRNTDTRQINREVDLPWEALREIEQYIDSTTGFSFEPNPEKVESISQDNAVKQLMSSEEFLTVFLLEYAVREECISRALDTMNELEKSNRKNLIQSMYSNERRARAYVSEIAEFARCSEQYVKDVISGRVDHGLSDSERSDILSRDDHMCQMCESEEDLEVHHIIPVSRGGTKKDSNLCTLCVDCHIKVAHGGDTSGLTYNTKDEFWDIVESKKQKP